MDLKLYHDVHKDVDNNQSTVNDTMANDTNPCDIDSQNFQPDAYLCKLIREKSLVELMEQEQTMVKDIRNLDSDMQTLVYENYNKFISATDTIRKMKNDFKKMEDEMDHLAKNMAKITTFSANISDTLQDRHHRITKLASVHSLLKKLQFLFELPARMKTCMENGSYRQAVTYYMKAERVLEQYRHMPSFQGIHEDCVLINQQLCDTLRTHFEDKESSPKQLAECVDLLLQLNEPSDQLCDKFLSHASQKIDEDLLGLECQIAVKSGSPIPARTATVDCYMTGSMKEAGDNAILVRSLDRFHRRLQAMNKLLPDTDFSSAGIDIVSKAAKDRSCHYLQCLKQHFSDRLTDIRHSLAAPRLLGKHDHASHLADLLSDMHSSIIEQIKSVLNSLQDFCHQAFDRGSAPPTLLLILSRFCIDLESTAISYLLTLTEEMFLVDVHNSRVNVSELGSEGKDTAQKLLNQYVCIQGITISQMLRKSIETRDWLNTIEPRNVRAVMKRMVEDVTTMDQQVGQLFEEGCSHDRSSDSSRRMHHVYSVSQPSKRLQWNYPPSVDNSLMSNIQKLFSEKIEVFGTVEFCKSSVLTGIIKICLKTYMECVRLRTFGRYGLQQTQVDTHYLQLYLWKFVSDENLVHVLLDEIVCSAMHRCVDPVTMEPSVIDLICERG